MRKYLILACFLYVGSLALGAETTIDAFGVSAQGTGNAFFTGSPVVDVNLAASGPFEIVGYNITEVDTAPATWLPDPPSTCTIATGEGDKTLYAWVKDDQDAVVSATASIFYYTAVPEIRTARTEVTSSTITVLWDTSVDAVGWVQYGLQGEPRDTISDPTGYTTAHFVDLIDLIDNRTYEIEIHSNSATLLTTAATTAAIPTTQDVTWAGRAEDLSWTVGANWQALQPPASPTTGRVIFVNAGALADGSTTNVLDADRAVGGLTIAHQEKIHTTDLAGHALVVNGSLLHGRNVAGGKMNIIGGGSLQVGTPEQAADMIIGEQGFESNDPRVPQSLNTILTLSGLTFTSYLNNLRIGATPSAWYQVSNGILDLTGATIGTGTIAANTAVIGFGQGSKGCVKVSGTSGLTDLRVKNYLELGTGHGGIGGIGDPANGTKLPPDVNVTLGEWGGTRCKVEMGIGVLADSGSQGQIIASSGGTCSAYLSTVRIGCAGGGNTLGMLDLTAMNGITLDAQSIELNSSVPTAGPGGKAYLRLPGGTAAADSVIVANASLTNAGTLAELQLNGTVFSANTISVGGKGTIDTHVAGSPCGLDLADGAALAVAGKIAIGFDQNPADTGIYWGLRWAGNHLGELGTLLQSGKLALAVGSGVTGTAGILYQDAFTYVALKETWDKPTAMARNLVLEVAPPDFPSVSFAAADVDAGSTDFSGLAIVGMTISSPDDVTPGDELVTLSALGPHEVTLTVTNSDGVPDSATCTVTLAEPTPTTADLTWSGAASTPNLTRKEWTWGQNWQGGSPPADATTGTITFDAAGSATDDSVTSMLSHDYSIGGLKAVYTSNVKHRTDLDGNTLTVTGTMMFGENTPVKPFTLANGTVQMGTPESPAKLSIGYSNGYVSPSSSGVLNIIGELKTNLAECNVGYQTNWWETGEARLDLTGATFPDGKFAAGTLRVGYRSGSQPSTIRLAEGAGLTDIITTNLMIGNWGKSATGRIGVPGSGYKLPADVNVKIGTPANRGVLWLGSGCVSWANDSQDGMLASSSGGVFEACLSEMRVAYNASVKVDTSTGLLDIRTMSSCLIDATVANIAVSAPGLDSKHLGSAYLPAGTFTAGTLNIGQTNVAGSSGLLQLNGTICRPGTLGIGGVGKIETNVADTSSGLDLADGAAVSVADGGLIAIAFTQAPAASGVHWGLRWAGDHTAELQALADAGKLTWDDSALGATASIFAQDGNTYVGASISMANVTGFTVSDATSGSSLITNAAAVTVAIAGEATEGQTIVAYAVNETGSVPADGDWQASVTSYTITAASGTDVALYAWVKDSAGNVGSKPATIYYNSAAPVIMAGPTVTDNGDGTATVTWTTDIPALGSANYGPVKLSSVTPSVAAEAAIDTSHSVLLTGLNPVTTNYKIVVVNTEVAAPAVFWPAMWPIPCDVNKDCKVNILDLISVRNKLNQPVTGDNVLADVNLPAPDGKINILDLIAVRNKLNTSCPQ